MACNLNLLPTDWGSGRLELLQMLLFICVSAVSSSFRRLVSLTCVSLELTACTREPLQNGAAWFCMRLLFSWFCFLGGFLLDVCSLICLILGVELKSCGS